MKQDNVTGVLVTDNQGLAYASELMVIFRNFEMFTK